MFISNKGVLTLDVRIADEKDLEELAYVHESAFTRQKRSKEWLACTIKAFPRNLCFVVKNNNKVCGYITWAQKSGFRPEVVLELEQIAIHPNYQNKGIGQTLIRNSLEQVKDLLLAENSIVKHILVSTRTDNYAQKIYRKVLGAEVEATIDNLFSADEVYMVARNV